jgi:hypothetical protein
MDSKTSHQLLSKIAAVKSADLDLAQVSPSVIAGVESEAKSQAIRNILQAGVVSAGGAAGFRGAQGLWNLLTRTDSASSPRAGISTLPVPYTAEAEEEEEEEFNKAATDEAAAPAPYFSQDRHVKTSPSDYASWYWPGMLAAALAGGVGGWKLSDSFFDNRRQQEGEDELETAKQDFREALTSHYSGEKQSTEKSAACKLGEELDEMFGRFNKFADGDGLSSALGLLGDAVSLPGKAIDTVTSPEFKEKALGGYGVYAVASMLPGYLVAKYMADKQSQRKTLEKALRRRAASNYAKRPSSLYAVPDPQAHIGEQILEDEEE